MAFSVTYTQAQYQAKITELEGYYKQLELHLGRMQELRNQMFDFWNDENAQTTGLILSNEIRAVQTAMDRTADTITFYKSTIDKMEGANIDVVNTLQDALGLIAGLS